MGSFLDRLLNKWQSVISHNVFDIGTILQSDWPCATQSQIKSYYYAIDHYGYVVQMIYE